MMPIGPLMIEHRLIERMIALLAKEVARIRVSSKVDVDFVVSAVDFIRTYADRCHHGKEEDILFRDLKKKPLSTEHARILRELEEDHVRGREIVKKLIAARERYLNGDKRSVVEIGQLMQTLVEFYPKHIDKEDRHFFIPCMDYFSAEEQAAMLQECQDFDRRLIHEKYERSVELLEERGQE
jgi:hemerythrin-like domain-containing protein